MNEVKIGDKFIVEIAEIIKGGETGQNQYRVKGFDKVFFDDKGLSYLELYNKPIETSIKDTWCFSTEAEAAWCLAREIMNIPIHDRAKIFNVSKNSVSFKDISENFTVNEAAQIYNKYTENVNKLVQQDLLHLAKIYSYSLPELKNVLEKIIR